MPIAQKPTHMRNRIYVLVLIFLLLGVAELFSYAFLSLDISAIQHRIYWPPVVSESQFQSYLSDRDPLLGWPTRGFLATYADSDGARLSPANRKFAGKPVCVSTYGDSFTYSDEVDHEDAWPNHLAEHLRCPVKNYGGPGYGIDQAVIRFQHNTTDQADLTILGFYVLDVTRNMNQWRYLINSGNPFSFKPSFALERDDELILHRIPVNSYRDFVKAVDNPAEVLKAERYLPNAPALPAPTRAEFPYSLSLVLFVKNQIIDELNLENVRGGAELREWNYPHWYDTKAGPWPETIALNTAIVGEFARECERRKRQCVVLAIPDVASVRLAQERGRSELDQFLDPVEEHVEVWRAVEFFARQTGHKGVCYYFGEKRDCRGHLNRDGYALLAAFVAEQIRTRKPGLFPGRYPEAPRASAERGAINENRRVAAAA